MFVFGYSTLKKSTEAFLCLISFQAVMIVICRHGEDLNHFLRKLELRFSEYSPIPKLCEYKRIGSS